MKKTLATSYMARLGVAGAFASATLFAVVAHAQDSRLSLADRVSRLEQQSQAQAGTTSLVNQVNDLQQQVSQLQGQIEELQHQNQQLQDSQKAQYADLDSRLGRLEKGGAASAQPAPSATTPSAPPPAAVAATPAAQATQASAAAPQSAPSQPASADQQAAYDAAFKSLRAGDYVTASRGFRDFLVKYPDSPLAPNAYYWLGESYYVTMNYPVAIEAFQRLVKQYPQSDKVSDGLLKVGYCQIELKQQDAAVATLKQVTTKYPGTKAAGLAQERLRRLQRQTAN
ncbi:MULTISPECIES: tol-pal system protein YbgF [unclassified Luteibacter]|uniref:tol-pal system protein YbgF n=1 Tax=unclassified Luteibacter TaxID=2620188 RepID=UPI0008CF2E1C|nr:MULTISPECIES: tol-pal system protein YbgF [unclassified Luteibacter]MDR6938437.1 tol-pal system protein YbgF [Luteibacter sp. 3190]SEP10475.1 tol-pal system protein YbgF [Luteibacter sp. UNC138MFCol5.1]